MIEYINQTVWWSFFVFVCCCCLFFLFFLGGLGLCVFFWGGLLVGWGFLFSFGGLLFLFFIRRVQSKPSGDITCLMCSLV